MIILRFCLRISAFASIILIAPERVPSNLLEKNIESGTLVMAARTDSSVIIGADSKVSNYRLGDLNAPIKILDIGKNSACAIEGLYHLRGGVTAVDIPSALIAWIRLHPETELPEAFPRLLESASAEWNRVRPTKEIIAETNRGVGSQITSLTCGGMLMGHPAILRGALFVEDDYSATWKRMRSEEGDVFYTTGVFDTSFFVRLVSSSEEPGQIRSDIDIWKWTQVKDDDRAFRVDFRANEAAMKAFDKFQTSERSTGRASSNITYTYTPSTWKQTDAKDLFGPVFSLVEKHYPAMVGPPNNVRIITQCGRFATTVEGEWPTCPQDDSTQKQK
jgi:hypothetical protein